MSKKNADYSIGYERLLVHFSDVQEQSPKGISLKRTGQTITFQFNLTGSRRNKASGCSFSYDGIALRHLANLNGMAAGISIEVRSQSLGHSPQQNESIYKKRQHTTETLNLLLNSNKQAIDLLSAINEARSLLEYFPGCQSVLAKLLSKIYSKDEREIAKLLFIEHE